MSEQIREQVSAFLDGELPDSESELLLKRLSRDAELREAFGRYALIAEVVRSPNGGPLSRGFAAGVNRRIDGEPAMVVNLPQASRSRRWWRPLAGAAVAAGVAAIAVVSLERRADVPALTAANQPAAAATVTAVRTSAAVRPREAVSYTVPAAAPEGIAAMPAARLTNYVFAHSKYSSALGQRNVLSGLIAEAPSEQPPPSDPLPQSEPLINRP
jgi:sigma-E factor negative regulatory protein RseA